MNKLLTRKEWLASLDKAIKDFDWDAAFNKSPKCVCGEPNSAGTHRTDGPCLAPQPEQEPVGWAEHGVINWLADKQFNHTSFLYATPPQRTWVGLTEQDRMEISDKLGLMDVAWLDLMEAIEAKLKEKNT